MSFVYVLINEAMPGYAKIGQTGDIAQRMRSLNNTSVPLPFECFYAAKVEDAVYVEKQLHDAFADQRVTKSREFFQIAPERVMAALKLAALEDATPREDIVENADEQRALDEARSQRSRFNFRMVDIPAGSELAFVKDESIKATVLDSTHITFRDQQLSLSQAALDLLQEQGYAAKTVQGPRYWMYEGEALVDRRLRMEESE